MAADSTAAIDLTTDKVQEPNHSAQEQIYTPQATPKSNKTAQRLREITSIAYTPVEHASTLLAQAQIGKSFTSCSVDERHDIAITVIQSKDKLLNTTAKTVRTHERPQKFVLPPIPGQVGSGIDDVSSQARMAKVSVGNKMVKPTKLFVPDNGGTMAFGPPLMRVPLQRSPFSKSRIDFSREPQGRSPQTKERTKARYGIVTTYNSIESKKPIFYSVRKSKDVPQRRNGERLKNIVEVY
ncbi:hypothetical protein K435DRAFT_777053 [Dendrothele bispora CBS 962.96]|uniref:Uncharacterized protein n=1 Tax=Dendrothele bispora (strain CBS 962.96) TaxID=1314807 RepID=A0A4V4HGN3_DENBC|nr:hypothetical protein K435DRAFT_777053 [Dendrothele bispora CBS 962.96]